MSDPLDELDGTTQRHVSAWRDEILPQERIPAALARLARRGPGRVGRRVTPLAIAAAMLLALLAGVPAAWAEVSEALAAPPPVPPLPGWLRPVLIAHVVCLLAAYACWLPAWALPQVGALVRLFGWRWGGAPAFVRWAVAAGGISWLAGVLLGMVWAGEARGRYWGWDGVELAGLATLLVGGAWAWLARRRYPPDSLAPAIIAAVAFWVIIDLWLGSLALPRHAELWRSALLIAGCALANAILLVATRRY